MSTTTQNNLSLRNYSAKNFENKKGEKLPNNRGTNEKETLCPNDAKLRGKIIYLDKARLQHRQSIF